MAHIVVGTPWFITHTDSVGCLLRLTRLASKKHIKKRKQQQQTTRKNHINTPNEHDGKKKEDRWRARGSEACERTQQDVPRQGNGLE